LTKNGSIDVRQERLRPHVHVSLENDALGEVRGIRRVVRAEDAVEVLADGHQADVVAEVRAEDPRRRVRRRVRENPVVDRRPVVVRQLDVRLPALVRRRPRQLLVHEADASSAVDRERRVDRTRDDP
jgi:hypothetical protein